MAALILSNVQLANFELPSNKPPGLAIAFYYSEMSHDQTVSYFKRNPAYMAHCMFLFYDDTEHKLLPILLRRYLAKALLNHVKDWALMTRPYEIVIGASYKEIAGKVYRGVCLDPYLS